MSSFFIFNEKSDREEDAISGSTITCSSGSSYEWTSSDEDDEEMSSANKDDIVDEEMQSMSEAGEEIPSMNEAVEDDTHDECSSDVPYNIEEDDHRPYVRRLKLFKARQPLLKEWVDSWTEIENPYPGYAFLNVYGYFNRDKGYGGYGVILRNEWLKPVIGASCFTQGGGSRLFQVLCGMKTGFELAVKHGCLRLVVDCNMRKAVHLFTPSFETGGSCCFRNASHVITEGICKECTKSRVLVRSACLETVIPVMKELKGMQAKFDKYAFHFSAVSRVQNEAAHYLAKMAKKNAFEVDPLAGKESKEEIKPVDFPHKLGQILWNEAFGCNTKYSHELVLLMTRNELC